MRRTVQLWMSYEWQSSLIVRIPYFRFGKLLMAEKCWNHLLKIILQVESHFRGHFRFENVPKTIFNHFVNWVHECTARPLGGLDEAFEGSVVQSVQLYNAAHRKLCTIYKVLGRTTSIICEGSWCELVCLCFGKFRLFLCFSGFKSKSQSPCQSRWPRWFRDPPIARASLDR